MEVRLPFSSRRWQRAVRKKSTLKSSTINRTEITTSNHAVLRASGSRTQALA